MSTLSFYATGQLASRQREKVLKDIMDEEGAETFNLIKPVVNFLRKS